MTDSRREKQRAYEVANARHARFQSRFVSSSVLGATAAETMDDESRMELARLDAERLAAYEDWQRALRA